MSVGTIEALRVNEARDQAQAAGQVDGFALGVVVVDDRDALARGPGGHQRAVAEERAGALHDRRGGAVVPGQVEDPRPVPHAEAGEELR